MVVGEDKFCRHRRESLMGGNVGTEDPLGASGLILRAVVSLLSCRHSVSKYGDCSGY